MLTRNYDTMRSSLDLWDPFKLLGDLESRNWSRTRSDTIDNEGIKIELPGVKPGDVDVSVEGRVLKVTGKSRHGADFSYVYTLKSNIDDAAIAAKLEDGLLTISLPLKQESQARKIPVNP